MTYLLWFLEAIALRWFQVQLDLGWWPCVGLWIGYAVFLLAEASVLGDVRRFLKREAPPVSLNCPLGQSEPARAPQAKA